ncbi:MAG: hypothetical protein MZV65_41195 [Chromatiales bacterium]|nr:hypothetical protein [Chromatiales bacterium]
MDEASFLDTRSSSYSANQNVVWDTTCSLAQFYAEQPESAQPVVHSAFLEIGGETALAGAPLDVALDIPQIDEPTILRTIIMIRNYKRLHPGRHEFGEPRAFLPHTAG